MASDYVDLIRATGDAASHRHHFLLWPKQWTTYDIDHEWHLRPLRPSERADIPDAPGIYSLIAASAVAAHPSASYLMYVGRTVSLRRRFGEYLTTERRITGRPKVYRVLHLYSDYLWFAYTYVDHSDLEQVEKGIRDALLPPLNDQFSAEINKVVGAFT